MPRYNFTEEFNCEDCTEGWPCAQHEEQADELCQPDPDRGYKEARDNR